MRRLSLIMLMFLGLISSWILPSSGYSQMAEELKGVWLTNIDSDVLFSQASTSEAIATLGKLNFNRVYPTVWNWGYTLYPSDVAKQVIGVSQDPIEGLKNRDLLQEIIEKAHQENVAVIPWFEFGFMAPADSILATKHPTWLTQRQDKTTIWLEGNIHKRVWLNPLRADVQEFITSLVLEIVSNYDIDGIQFDDHFGFPSDFGYDDFTVNLYQQEHSGQLPPTDYQDSAWVKWRAKKITDYMGKLFRAIKDKKNSVLVSVSPNPQDFSLQAFLLDWQTWERTGLIEELVLQIYRSELKDFVREITKPEVQAAKTHIPVAIGILAGLKGRPVPMNRIKTQVNAVRKLKFAGVSMFFYESLWNFGTEPPKERQKAFQSLFSLKI